MPREMKQSQWKSLQRKVARTIRLALDPTIKYTMINETSKRTMGES